jgi:RimJ/RimL family protein N-acetyltransferase
MPYKFIVLEPSNLKEFLPKTIQLLFKNKHWVFDDYILDPNIVYSDADIVDIVLKYINDCMPNFYIITKNDDYLGFFILNNFEGNSNNYHSCEITACCHPAYYGIDTRNVLKLITEMLFNNQKIIKICAKTNKKNRHCIKLLNDVGFKKEGFLKGSTYINKELQDYLIFGKIRKDVLKNEQ